MTYHLSIPAATRPACSSDYYDGCRIETSKIEMYQLATRSAIWSGRSSSCISTVHIAWYRVTSLLLGRNVNTDYVPQSAILQDTYITHPQGWYPYLTSCCRRLRGGKI